MPPQRMQLDQANNTNAFAPPEQRPRRLTINSIPRPHGPYREQRQPINSDLDADQDDEKPLPLHTASTSNSQPHRLHDSDGALDQWDQHRYIGQPSDQRPPSRLPGHNRSHSEVSLGSISPGFNRSIPSPLASPITATANSLTALTISSSGPYGISGRDLTKITVPRERRITTMRPNSVCSTESLLTQDHMKNGFGVSHSTLHLGQLSDSEIPNAHDHGARRLTSKNKRTHVQPPSPSIITTGHSSKKSAGLKSPTMKPASQLRVTLYNLVSNGFLPAETLVVFREHSAVITAKGTLIPQMKEPDAMAIYPWLQEEYDTPSAWATAMVKGGRTGKVAVNGWSAIKVPIHQDAELSKKYEDLGVAEASLDVFRKKYLAEITEDGDSPTAGDDSSGRKDKDLSALDRKKRKRPSTRPGDTIGLKITTSNGTRYKNKSEPTRPRKRTVSDLSSMSSSDLIQDRQLRWEAAGALFSMQDEPMSPMYDGFGRQKVPYQLRWNKHRGIIPLESLERRRLELESRQRRSSSSRISALRTLKPLSLTPVAIPLDLASPLAHMEFCILCGGTGSTKDSNNRHTKQKSINHQWSSAISLESGPDDIELDCDAMNRCFECGECYHIDCLAFDSFGERDSSSTLMDESWRCPRCTICQLCEKSVHQHPSIPTATGTSKLDSMPSMETDSVKALVCDQCHKFTHLQCQAVVEPALKSALRSSSNRYHQEWMCLSCRECVECGYRIKKNAKLARDEDDSESSSSDKGALNSVVADGRWSHGSALCPSCTTLAEKGNICPLCCTIYQDDDYDTPMIFCDGCSHWVHVACDKGLQDRDYEELGEDSKQYFCPSCLPTPIPSPALSSSSSILSTALSNDENLWGGPCIHGLYGGESCYDCTKDAPSNNEDDWHYRNGKKKDDILDLLKAAKEISDSESRATSPYSTYSSVIPSTHSRTMSASLESVAEVAAAEALLTIFSGASTPISSTPYTSYPPSPFEPSIAGPYDRHYSVINSPHDQSMAFTPSSEQESISSSHDRLGHPQEDYFNSRPYSRPLVPYYHIGQELEVTSAQVKQPLHQGYIMEPGDVIMEEGRAGPLSPRASEERDNQASSVSATKNVAHSDLYRPLSHPHHNFQRHSPSDSAPTVDSLTETVDLRTCLLCHQGVGSNNSNSNSSQSSLGRLLPLNFQNYELTGHDADSNTQIGWIHSNCALWSTGVTLEAAGGGMENVSSVVRQGRHVCCSSCGRPGATIKCKTSSSRATINPNACTAVFHYTCLNHLDQPHQPGQATNNAIVMDQKQRTVLCPMHYREVSTLNNLRPGIFAPQSAGQTSDSSMLSVHSSSLVPSVSLRNAWTGPYWIKDIRYGMESTSAQAVTMGITEKEPSFDGFRIGGLIVFSLGSFNSPASEFSETGIPNDIDLEACYKKDADKPLAELLSRDRVLALPLGFKCSRKVMLNNHPCVVTAEIVQRYRKSVSAIENTIASIKADKNESDELETAWKIVLVFSGGISSESSRDCEFFADSMHDAVDKIFSTADNGLNDDRQESRQHAYFLQSADTFFGVDHPLLRKSIRALRGEKEVASRMWTWYREVQRAADRQCNRHGCVKNLRLQRRDAQADDSGDWESTTAARVRSRPGSLQSRKRISRIGIARSNDLSLLDSATKTRKDIANKSFVPGLFQELIRASISAASDSGISSAIAPSGISDAAQKTEQKDTGLTFADDRILPRFEITQDRLQSLRVDQLKNVALFWNGRKIVSPQHNASAIQSSETATLNSLNEDNQGLNPVPENMEIDNTLQTPQYPSTSSSSLPITDGSKLSTEPHTDIRVYTARSFQPDEIIMEYTGEVLHPSIAIRRQESYQRQGRSCYMMWCEFQDVVIDATQQGGLARYIRNENRHRQKHNNVQQQRTVYARTATGPTIHEPRVVICAAKFLNPGEELILRYC
ncbi:hypothetical protein FBU30_002335 [Linnemannia zychae]|nr:hypothetical protein FBU30_002335 [Linnemannia zychae]